MEKLGLKDGEHIESKLVTRAVENAQKKVENLHFESRKHLLEYDDVANEQRKSVYKFRDELLDINYDISAKIAENREYALNQIFSKLKAFDHQNLSKEELLGLKNILKEDFNAHVELEDLEKASPIEKFVAEKLKSDYENKMKALDSEQRSRIERIVYLQILDNAWREHLYTMDNLKTGINLRGYNQKDPLVEYKKESYNLFLELIEDIKIEAIKTFSKIQFENEQDSSDAERYLDNFSEEREHESVTYRHEEALDEDLNVAVKAFSKTPKRNEPCPCGSGKKYKDCCAKSGPKKGLFAK